MGPILKCAVPNCYKPNEFLVRGLCEFHYNETIRTPKLRELERAKIVVERISGEVAKFNNEIHLAKLEYGIKPPPVWMHCNNHDKGCPFKTINTRNLEIHQTVNCQFHKKAKIATNGVPRAPRVAKTRAEYVLTDDDLTDEE